MLMNKFSLLEYYALPFAKYLPMSQSTSSEMSNYLLIYMASYSRKPELSYSVLHLPDYWLDTGD